MKVSKLMLCGASVFAMAACSIDEVSQVNDTNAVTFKAVVPSVTRACAVTTNTLGDFSVWGYNDGGAYMDCVTATNNGSGVYTTNPTYFWPTGSLDFLAIHPVAAGVADDGNVYFGSAVTDEVVTDESGTVAAYEGYAVETVADESTGRIGKLAVCVPSDYSGQFDLCYAVTPDKSAGSVSMNFRHALTQVVFAARTSSDAMNIQIAGVKVCSVHNYGEYTLPTESTELDSSGIGEWTLGYANNGTEYVAGLGITAEGQYIQVPTDYSTAQLTDSDGSLFLLPQEVPAWDIFTDHHLEGVGAYFRVNCRIFNEVGDQIWPSETKADANGVVPDFAEIAVPVDINWLEGYKYTYTFIFGEGAGYYPPDDTDDPYWDSSVGTPVLLPVTFDVNFDDFNNLDSVNVDTDADDFLEDIIPYLGDYNFRKFALENYDLNGDGKVSSAEASRVISMICNTVTDFTGIEYFPNLERFISYSVKTVDLSCNANLTYILLSDKNDDGPAAPIKTLDLSNNLKLESLPMYAFYGCENLETVILPESLTDISSYAFYKCTALKDIKLSDEMTVINNNVFDGCASLESITLPAALVEIGSYAFYNCSSLKSVAVPEGLTTIGTGAFCLCTSLTEFDFIEGLETLGEYAFYGTGLVSVVLPESLTSIGGACFYTCTSLETIDFSKTGLTSLPFYTCMNCTSLTSVSLPEKLTEIGNSVFYGCVSLAYIELPAALKSIGRSVFNGCTVLDNLTIPENVTSIGDSAFVYCDGMTTMYALPSTPPEIGERTFYGLRGNGLVCYLYVPAEYVETYTEAWGEWFTSVSAIEN